jgi:hypothetical protein
MRGKPQPRRPFNPRGSLLWIRHPVYLGFLGLIWFTPVMTADRAILVATWTVYVFIGSWLKDGRLLYYIGEPYRTYQSQITGYPGMIFGPLGRRPLATTSAVTGKRCDVADAASIGVPDGRGSVSPSQFALPGA